MNVRREFKREANKLTELEKKILNVVENENNRPIPVAILINKVNHFSNNAVFSAIKYLVENSYLEKMTNGKLILGYVNGELLEDQKYEGTVVYNSKGDGFFKLNNQKDAFAYINKKNLKNVLDGDKVEICLLDRKPTYKDTKDAIVLKVIERSRDFFTGTYYSQTQEDGSRNNWIEPDDSKITLKIILDDSSELVNGNKVLFKIGNITNNTIFCSVAKVLGHINDVGSDIISIVYDKGIEPEFNDKVNEEIKKIDFNFNKAQDRERKDLSSLNFITIDPAESKDMDDAICVLKNENGTYKLYVAIADVSYYVKLKSALWESTLNRGTSIYLVDRVIPMLPHKLSNEICSLNPHEKRYAVICDMDIDENGEFKQIYVYQGIINSKHKFAYDEVNTYFDNKTKDKKISNDLYNMLDDCLLLNESLNKKISKNGYIDFDIKEPKIILDKKGQIQDIIVKPTGVAQKMIENFMVAANEAVTLKFRQLNKKPKFLYRVHDKPSEEKINAFAVEAKKLGFIYDNTLKEWLPDTVSKWLAKNKDNDKLPLINMVLLRTMAKAKYQTYNIGHFGLAIRNYTHFTSPIRRLADVIVHYLLRMFIFDKKSYTDEEKNYIVNNLNNFCEKANNTEVLAVETERDVNTFKFAEYMQQKIGAEYEGFVSYITSFGLFVQLENTIEGLVKPVNIKDDFYMFDKDDLTYKGQKNHKVITLGQKVKIKVLGANKQTRKIDFEIIEFI